MVLDCMGVTWTCCLNSSCRVRRGVSNYKLVLGIGYTLGQSAVCTLEPDCRGLPTWLRAAGYLGPLWQGLGASESPAWQPARLLALVSWPCPACQAHCGARSSERGTLRREGFCGSEGRKSLAFGHWDALSLSVVSVPFKAKLQNRNIWSCRSSLKY